MIISDGSQSEFDQSLWAAGVVFGWYGGFPPVIAFEPCVTFRTNIKPDVFEADIKPEDFRTNIKPGIFDFDCKE